MKVTTVKDIERLRKAFRTMYAKFAKDFDELGKRFRQVSIDSDLMLAAAEEIMKQ